jgi:hypothetical protein
VRIHRLHVNLIRCRARKIIKNKGRSGM